MELEFNNVISYVLIVDDDKDDQMLLRNAINKVVPNVIIESLYDGSEALTFLDHCVALPNVIFLDLNMLKVSGKTTMKVIRENKSLVNVPVIVLTTSNNVREKDELMKLGATAFYTKPYSGFDLVNIVQEVKEKWIA